MKPRVELEIWPEKAHCDKSQCACQLVV
ncbi:hypothetical protein D043_0549A, partial [Vibrio parahaemolyticus EKP-021]